MTPSPDAQGPEGTPAAHEDPDGGPDSDGALRRAFRGTDTGAFVGMSKAIRNLGLNLTPIHPRAAARLVAVRD